jgi:hypothetical protein
MAFVAVRSEFAQEDQHGRGGSVIRIGCGAGFAGDRFDPAQAMLDERVDYLVFECLAERTIAHRQAERDSDGSGGYDPYLPRRIGAVLSRAVTQGTRIITNAGAANPLAGGRAVASLAEREGLPATVAVVTGDDVLDLVDIDAPALEDGLPLGNHGEIVSANAYVGVDAVLPALATGADVVVTGRVADPSLFAAPVLHGLGWNPHNAAEMATATVAGHLLECGAQVTGGYFADPGRKDVVGLDRLGFPIAEVTDAGSTVVTKPAGTGGVVDARTVKEQLLYEVLDPAAYVTPDGSIDLTTASVEVLGPDRVRVAIGPARPRPDRLKVNVGYLPGTVPRQGSPTQARMPPSVPAWPAKWSHNGCVAAWTASASTWWGSTRCTEPHRNRREIRTSAGCASRRGTRRGSGRSTSARRSPPSTPMDPPEAAGYVRSVWRSSALCPRWSHATRYARR